MINQCWPFAEMPQRCDLNQKKRKQSPNGLKNPHYFHIRMLLLMAITG